MKRPRTVRLAFKYDRETYDDILREIHDAWGERKADDYMHALWFWFSL